MKKVQETPPVEECEPDSKTPASTEAPNVIVAPPDSPSSEDISPRSKENAHAVVMEILGCESS